MCFWVVLSCSVYGLHTKKRKNPLKTLKTFKTPKNLKPKNLFFKSRVFYSPAMRMLHASFTHRGLLSGSTLNLPVLTYSHAAVVVDSAR